MLSLPLRVAPPTWAAAPKRTSIGAPAALRNGIFCGAAAQPLLLRGRSAPSRDHPIHWLTGAAASCKGCATTSINAGPSCSMAALIAASSLDGSSTRQAFTP
ncbi:hypothetical protein G6F35_018557 [Rhizopus arrhizus]|nr:hypothetical protein G6F35_018557 [Rhizopus arrhizus]KAG1242450.1 hypothetical protein G6F65_023015 [Rhizopus arrhizus]